MDSKLFSIFAVISAAGVVLSKDFRRSIFLLWGTGLFISGLFLSVHAELLALVQSLSTSLICVGFLVFSSSLGNRGPEASAPKGAGILVPVSSLVGASVFVCALSLLEKSELMHFRSERMKLSLSQLGSEISSSQNLLALVLVVLALLASMIGSGSIARPEKEGEENA